MHETAIPLTLHVPQLAIAPVVVPIPVYEAFVAQLIQARPSACAK